MIINLIKKTLFLTTSLLLLIFGFIGINRSSFVPAAEFQWENRGSKVVVSEIIPGGVAQQAGLEIGDLLIKMDDSLLDDGNEIEFNLIKRKASERISFTIQRKKQEFTLSLILGSKFGNRFIILNMLLGVLFWIIGIFVYLKKSEERAARIFSWGCIVIATIIMMIWPGYPYEGEAIGYLLPTIFFILYTLAPIFILYFSIIYPDEKHLLQKYKFLPAILICPGIIFIILLEISYLATIHLKSFQYYLNFYHIYNAFRVYFIFYLILGVGCLIHSYKFSDSKENKKKIQWLLLGICVGTTPFFLLWSFPQVLGFSPLIPEEVNYIFLTVIPLAFAFSIVRYQVLDIELIINRGIVYALVTGVIVTLYLVLVGLVGHLLHTVSPKSSSFLAIIFTLIAAALFSPLKQRMQTFVDKTFYRVKYNYRFAVKDYGSVLTSAYEKIRLIDLIIEKINAAIPVEKIALILRPPSDKAFKIFGSLGITKKEQSDLRLEVSTNIAKHVEFTKKPLVKKGRAEISSVAELQQGTVLDKIGIELLIPIMLQEQLMGFLVLGKKLSEVKFSEEDLELLSTMATDGFIAFERLRLQESMILEQAEKEKLEELSRLKSEFISHVSHELRTPLTSITWSVENLLDGIPEKPSAKVKEYLTGIYNCSQHLSRMIENLLNITRIEAGKIEIYTERLNLFDEIQKSVELSKPLAEKKEIYIEALPAANLWVKADRDHLQAILTNLLDNAIKYSDKGSVVQIKAKIVDEEGSKRVGNSLTHQVAILVVDHGAGIPKEKQQAIFERFERVKKEKASREKGLGLGLHIVKKFVELQGGRIWLESELEQGSTFTFTLPIE